MRVALYARVSTKDGRQDAENQLIELREFVERQNRVFAVSAPNSLPRGGGWAVVAEFVDRWSGSAGADSRDGLKELLREAARGKFDLVLVTALDRFTREGIPKAFEYVTRLRSAGVLFQSIREEFTKPPFGDLFLSMFAWMAAYERIQISARVKAGVARAKAQGRQLGRPACGLDPQAIISLRDTGLSMVEVGKTLKIGRSTLYRLMRTIEKDGDNV